MAKTSLIDRAFGLDKIHHFLVGRHPVSPIVLARLKAAKQEETDFQAAGRAWQEAQAQPEVLKNTLEGATGTLALVVARTSARKGQNKMEWFEGEEPLDLQEVVDSLRHLGWRATLKKGGGKYAAGWFWVPTIVTLTW